MRPIGIGEVLRRIVGKSVMILLKADITAAAGPLQACAGHRGGVEAAVHAMKDIFDDPNTEAVLLVDASNAFNSMNGHVHKPVAMKQAFCFIHLTPTLAEATDQAKHLTQPCNSSRLSFRKWEAALKITVL